MSPALAKATTKSGVFAVLLASSLSASTLDIAGLQHDIAALAVKTAGRLGVCVQTGTGSACVHPRDRFPMQSVMKLLVGFAVMDAVDSMGWRLDEPVTVYKRDLSVFVQPLANLVGNGGYRTTIGDLVRRAVIDSDSAATDFLITRLHGTEEVIAALNRHGITGLRVDRNERRLQTEIVGLVWRPEYVDSARLDRDIAAVPAGTRDRAYAAYQRDPRDTSTPPAMASFLLKLAQGRPLSAGSTAFLLQGMRDCALPGPPEGGCSWRLADHA